MATSRGHCKSQGYDNFSFKNWSETYSASPKLYFEPENESELKDILQQAESEKSQLKVIGGCLSPSDIACTNDYMVSLKRMNKVLDVDTKDCTITVQAGVLISDLNNDVLPSNGLAFSNLASVSEQSVGGIIATGTHGTGANFGSFAECVLELWLMTCKGEVIHCSQTHNPTVFSAACCHLGLLGVLVAAKLQCEPAFSLLERQISCSFDHLLDNFDTIVSSSQHFRAQWFPHTDHVVLKHAGRTKKARTLGDENWVRDIFIGYYILQFCLWIASFLPALVPIINRLFYRVCYSGKRQKVERSDRVLNINCLFRQYVTEWAIPRESTVKVMKDMKQWLDSNKDVMVHFPVEVRVVKKDNILLSPSGDGDVTYIGIISYRPYGKFVPHDRWWNFFENAAKAVGGKPHWAKDHKETSKYLRKVYKHYDAFMAVRKQLDPNGMFVNDYWKRVFKDSG